MKICFPARKKGGKDYISVDDIMTQVQGEPHGGWLAGSNLLWHGGLHISTVTAPDSVLTAETADTAVPLQFMAGGEVVAWRLNRDYLKSQYNGQTLQYSSTFVLVKSVCQPDPKERKTWLEFYSLYMGLAPLSAFQKCKCMKAKTKVIKRKAVAYEMSQGAEGIAPAPAREGDLAKGSRVLILKEKTFMNSSVAQPFGLAQQLDNDGYATGKTFWVTLLPEYMAEDGEQYAHLPAWMQQAVAMGNFDTVTKPGATLKINAGDAVGFLAKDIDPVGMGKVESSHFAHIEVLSHDARMPAFLDNPGSITGGRQYIRIPSGKSLYQKTGSGDAGTFRAMSCVIVKDSGKILPADKCNPQKDAQGKTWYEISPGNWMRDSDVDVLHQYDLRELGFTALEEAPTADMSKSLREGWMKSAFNWLSEQVNRDRGIRQQQVSDYYKKAVSSIDTDGDGELSAEELFYAVHHPEMEIRNIAARMVVKHDSEWFGDSSHHKWEVYFQNFDILRMKYAKQWRDDMEWMSQVEAFKSGAPVWHMHPVVFLSALQIADDCAKLIWGDVVNQRLGAEKACQFRRKVVKICSELWGEEKKLEFANSLMACMAVETSRLFSSSVVKLMPKINSQGTMLLNSKGKPIKEYRPLSRQELIADPSIAAQNAVGLIQFTGPAVKQINKTHNLSVTKQTLALMDELEQLDYVKLYFTSNKKLFNKIKSGDDVYLFIFCPAGVGQSNDFALYSRQKDEDEQVNYYRANSSLDSTLHGNNGNNDGIIQRGELLSRLNKLREEGRKYINKCLCNPAAVDMSEEPSGAQWVSRFPTSSSISALSPTFSVSVSNFIQSIQNAGGSVRVSATYRPVERAYLMHYSWKIAREGMNPSTVPAKEGVNIDWTHKGNHTAAVSAAQDMVNGYHIVYGPVLTSRHTQRRAIDMTITGVINKSVRNASGEAVLVQSQSVLHEIGASFGVHKLLSDPPHWSDDGH